MKVILVKSGREDYALNQIIERVSKVLRELEIEVKAISLDNLPYYKEDNIDNINDILVEIEESVGLIMASTVELLSISGSLCTFFEYCVNVKNKEIFNKPLFALAASDKRGERQAAEHMLNSWSVLGGSEFGKIGIYTPIYEENKTEILSDAEKQTEDFYRVIRQKRKAILSSDSVIFSRNAKASFEPVLDKQIEIIEETPLSEPSNTGKSSQEQDIQEITSLFKKQLNGNKNKAAPRPSLKTSRQLIASMPHYFQAQFAADFESIIQYNITDDENFKGYLLIKDGSCKFEEGIHTEADVELTASEGVFEDILRKKITSQKAFMLGQLKVRGNFMLLSNIDQMFKPM